MNKAWRRMTPIPLTGTAAGPMTEAERARYLAGDPELTPPPPPLHPSPTPIITEKL